MIPKGVCPVCGETKCIRKDGTLYDHYPQWDAPSEIRCGGPRTHCRGSHQTKPVTLDPRN